MHPVLPSASSAAPVRHPVARLIEWGASALYLLPVVLVVGIAARLTGHLVGLLLQARTTAAVMAVLDPVLLLMMLAELLHTMALTLRTHHLPLRPLVTLVFIAVVRHAVVLTSTRSLASADAAASLTGLVTHNTRSWNITLVALNTGSAGWPNANHNCLRTGNECVLRRDRGAG